VGEDYGVAWAWAYLAVSVVGAALVVNAYWPWRRGPASIFSFFSGWLTGELPIHNIVWQAAATAVFAVLGAFDGWPGWLGLGIALISWVGLIGLYRDGRRSHTVFERALDDIYGTPVVAGGADFVQPEVELSDPASDLSQSQVTVDDPDSSNDAPSWTDSLPWSDSMWRGRRLVNPVARGTRTFDFVKNVDYWGDGLAAHRLDIIKRKTQKVANPAPDIARSGLAPVFVYVHGGAWIGDKREQGFPMMLELARRGWVCVTINYRLSPVGLGYKRNPKATWPDHIVDCKRAVAWVKENIAQYGGDPRFVAISGGSAGGHLSALVALTPGDPDFQPGFEAKDTSVDACVPVYGVYDMTCRSKPGDPSYLASYNKGLLKMLEQRVFKTTLKENPAIFENASPLYRVNAQAPPFFVIHGMNDTLVPVSEARHFVEALRHVSKATVAYAELPRTQHAFDVLASVRPAYAISGVVRFLEGVRGATGPVRGQDRLESATGPGHGGAT
jgi:acetyl esterase/lipase